MVVRCARARSSLGRAMSRSFKSAVASYRRRFRAVDDRDRPRGAVHVELRAAALIDEQALLVEADRLEELGCLAMAARLRGNFEPLL